jgi:hypothetical protein
LLRILYSIDDYWTRSDFDLQAIASRTSRKLSAVTVNSTSGEILETVWDNCRESALNVEECDCHYRCGLAASNIDRMKLSRNQLPSVGWAEFDSSLDHPDYEAAIEDAEAIECYTVMPIQTLQKLGLKIIKVELLG